MKTKNLDKKLSLSKKTVADLNRVEMKTAKGGTASIFTCFPTICYYSCYCTNETDCGTVRSCRPEFCRPPIVTIPG